MFQQQTFERIISFQAAKLKIAGKPRETETIGARRSGSSYPDAATVSRQERSG